MTNTLIDSTNDALREQLDCALYMGSTRQRGCFSTGLRATQDKIQINKKNLTEVQKTIGHKKIYLICTNSLFRFRYLIYKQQIKNHKLKILNKREHKFDLKVHMYLKSTFACYVAIHIIFFHICVRACVHVCITGRASEWAGVVAKT